MLKKVLVGVLVTGLSAGLVAGALNRTAAKVERTGLGTSTTGGNQRQRTNPAFVGGSPAGQARGQQQKETTSTGVESAGRNGYAGRNGNGKGPSVDASPSLGSAEVETLYTIEGIAVGADEAALTLILADGQRLLIEGRAWSYAQESGFSTQDAHRILLTGFDENGEFKTVSILDLDSQVSVDLRAESGRPMWAGRGGRGA